MKEYLHICQKCELKFYAQEGRDRKNVCPKCGAGDKDLTIISSEYYTIENGTIKVPKKEKPKQGIYSDQMIYQAYRLLAEAVLDFIPDHSVSTNLKYEIPRMRAKSRQICNLASNLRMACNVIRVKKIR